MAFVSQQFTFFEDGHSKEIDDLFAATSSLRSRRGIAGEKPGGQKSESEIREQLTLFLCTSAPHMVIVALASIRGFCSSGVSGWPLGGGGGGGGGIPSSSV
jgi:hypothetical protein